jgi:hypothetical protein
MRIFLFGLKQDEETDWACVASASYVGPLSKDMNGGKPFSNNFPKKYQFCHLVHLGFCSVAPSA